MANWNILLEIRNDPERLAEFWRGYYHMARVMATNRLACQYYKLAAAPMLPEGDEMGAGLPPIEAVT